ncbi:MAG: hypothetical protein HGA29_02115, partial [Syntrophaceae bacterium]|nr:hypothetical protein [Syntrophaceae bacterium]
ENNQEIKQQVAPLPAPVTESARSQVKQEISRQSSVSSTTRQDREAPTASPQTQNRGQYASPPVAKENQQERFTNSPAPPQEERPTATALKDAEVMAKAEKSIAKEEAETLSGPTVLSSPQSRKSRMAAVGSASGESKDMMSAPSSLRSTQAAPMKGSVLNLMIQVPETNSGKRDIEACLNRFNARILERKQRGETIFLKAQIDARNIAAFVRQLEDIGLVRPNSKRLEFPAGNVAVEIRIDRLP